MIRTDRKKIGEPAIVEQAQQRFLAEVREYFRQPESIQRQTRPPSSRITSKDEVMAYILRLFHSKCAYCETHSKDSEIDHFRPHQVSFSDDNQPYNGYYAWLTAEWENLYLACGACLRSKRNLFPIVGKRGRTMASVKDLREQENYLLLDPCWDIPEKHLSFLSDGSVEAKTESGKTTIAILNLNRPQLLESRSRIAKAAIHIIDRSLRFAQNILSSSSTEPPNRINEEFDTLISVSQDDAPHAGVVRSLCQQSFGDDFLDALRRSDKTSLLDFFLEGASSSAAVPDLSAPNVSIQTRREETPSAELSRDFSDYSSQARHIRRIEIRNFKTIRDLRLDLPEKPGYGPPWMALLGENGTGKSSFLQATALALLGSHRANAMSQKPNGVLTKGEFNGYVRIYFWDYEIPAEIRFSKDHEHFEGKEDLSALVLGYGATRLPGGRRASDWDLANVNTLVRSTTKIPTSIRWLLNLPQYKFEAVARVLNTLLPVEGNLYLSRSAQTVKFEVNGHRTTLDNLSGGYRAVVGMALDIVRVMLSRWANLEDAVGVVLVDELETHLHPRWKMRIVNSLRNAFPRVQFIISTHDPLILRGLRGGEVAVLHTDMKRGTFAIEDLPSPEGLQVDQLLTSEHFGLHSITDPDTDRLFRQYYDLLAVNNPTSSQSATIQALQVKLENKGQTGATLREQMLLETIDKHLASKNHSADKIEQMSLKNETLQRLDKIMQSLNFVDEQ